MTITTKDERLALRVTAAQKAIIERASSVMGRTLTDFSVSTLVEKAEDVLADQRVFQIPADKWAEIETLMDAPVAPSPGLVDLFSKPSVLVAR